MTSIPCTAPFHDSFLSHPSSFSFLTLYLKPIRCCCAYSTIKKETKLQKVHEKLFTDILDGFELSLFNSSIARLGYSGTAVYSRYPSFAMQREIKHEAGDREGRVLMVEYPGMFLVNVYTVNSGNLLRRLPVRLTWDMAFRRFIRYLRDMGKPVMVVGDLNVARHDVDVFDVSAAQGIPGFSDEERTSFEDMLETCGMVDAYRMLYPDASERYTYWDYRTKARENNRGWRIDYVLVTNDMVDAVRDVRILNEVPGSDHCPIAVDIAPGFLS